MGGVPLALVTGPANAGKAHVILEAVRAHVAHAEDPLLVVPTEADQARYRRELAEGGLTLGARVERFEGLLDEVLRRVGKAHPPARPPLGSLARERVLARLADARPGMASELARLVAELETQRVTPARLRGALRAWVSVPGQLGGERATLERLCTVFERYHEALAKMGRADRELRVTAALDALRRKPALWGSTPVLLYGFDDLTELQLDAIETLGGVVGARVTVSLAYEPGRVVFAGRAGAFQRLAPLADAHSVLEARAEYYAPHARAALHHLERSLLSDDAPRVEPGDAVRLLEGGSPRAELELVAGEVRAALDAGVHAEEIAIVHRAPDTIAALIGEVLEDFAIPYSLRRRVGFAHTAVGRGLLGLLRCALGDGELGDLLAWLNAPGALERPELADRLEARARRDGMLDGASARAIWEAEHWPLDRIDRVREASERGLPALAEALAVELQRLFGAPRGAVAAVLAEDELDEARALTGARRALEEIRELACSAPALAPTPAELVELFGRLELSGGERLSAGRVVAVVDPLSLRARRVRLVFACGLQEGVFPAPPTPHPLLSEEDRRGLAHASGLALRGEPDALAAERYLLYALASRPEECLTLSWHTADDDGAPLAPSLFVDDVCDLFADTLRERTVRRFAGAAGWTGAGRPAGAMALREQAIASSADGVRPASIGPLRQEAVLGELRERTLWSASSLESWTGCPVKWFVERLLRADGLDPDPEPIARGALAHAALKDTLERLRELSGSARLTPASLALAKRLLREALAELHERHPLSVAPERVPGARRRLSADLERYLECAAEQASPLEPTHLELEFGFGGESEELGTGPVRDGKLGPAPSSLPALELGDGVLLRGRIDRVDLAAGGEAVVYDYKGRAAPPGASWARDGVFQVALYMRAVERLLGHQPAGGFYQPLAGRDIRARGVLDADSHLELDCVRTDRLGRADLHELIDECVAAALRAATQARSGALEPRPDTCAYGGGCAYPTICRCER
jgi:ATP-dependent helicase/DNAse subunit B